MVKRAVKSNLGHRRTIKITLHRLQCNTDDKEIKDTFEHDQQFVKPLLKRYQNLLDNKYLESPFRMELDSNVYGLLDTK